MTEFKEGEEYALDELPENDMNNSGNLEWVGDETLVLVHNNQHVELWYSSVKVRDVKYINDDGVLEDARPE